MDQNALFNEVKDIADSLRQIAIELRRRPNSRVVMIAVPGEFNPEGGKHLAKLLQEALNDDSQGATSSAE